MQLKNVYKTFTLMMILLLALFLNFLPSSVCATQVDMDDREINLKSSLVKWLLALNARPYVYYPNEPKLILATIAEDGLDDFACLLEVNKELRRDKAFNNIPVELTVQSTQSQKKKLYRAFSEASDLKINWIFKDERQEYDTSSMQMEFGSFTLSLSTWAGMRIPSTSNWLGIGQYSNIGAGGKSLAESFIVSLWLVENFHQRSGVSSLESMPLNRQTMNYISDFRFEGYDLCQNLTECSIKTEQHKFSIATPRFGLGELHLGLPFNSELIEKVDNYEISDDKTSTSLYKDLKQLLQDRPWLGLALTGHSDLDTQAEAIQNVSYYTAYYDDEAFLKEYLEIIRRIDPGDIKIVTDLKWSMLSTESFKEMLSELGFGNVHYKSNSASNSYCQRTTSEYKKITYSDCDPTVSEYRKITFIDSGFIDNDNAYNALAYFSQPLTLVTGDINLAKAITMNKIPFYQWRHFQTQVNEHLQSLWQGTGLESFFVNDYQPEIKAAALNQFNQDSPLRRQTNKQIIKAKNAMPDLLDVVWLVHCPNAEVWRLDTQVKRKLVQGENNELFDEIKNTESKDIRDILATKVLIQHIFDQNTGYDKEQLDEFFKLINDSRLREYLLSLLNVY
ncbi:MULTISPECIES: hypothetical protein [unclassified Endozoicomonas]|uniref:hypothetical protein n=1 Tax=unclassified Endozoicomonas TaxID=2644528 RepID=UPI003BB7A37A